MQCACGVCGGILFLYLHGTPPLQVNVVFMIIALRVVYRVKSGDMQISAKGMTSRAAGM